MKLLAQVGNINPPPGVPGLPPNDPNAASVFVAGLVRNGIAVLLIVAFIAALLWTIFAGFRFVFSGGDEKAVSSAWSQIYWGLIGMVVVMGAFAIIKLVEIFFNTNIISGGFQLPQR